MIDVTLQVYFKGRHYLISSIIKRLKELRSIVEDLRSTLRFFSTSLLIVTEGCVGRRTTTTLTRKRPNLSSGEEEDDSSMDSMDSSVELKCSVKSAKEQRTRRLQYICHSDHSRQFAHQKIDIRMIDFAHTSFSSQSSTDGFCVGLDNLIRLLDEMREPDLRSCEEATEDSDDGTDMALNWRFVFQSFTQKYNLSTKTFDLFLMASLKPCIWLKDKQFCVQIRDILISYSEP